MNEEQDMKEFYKAFSKFQGEISTVKKEKTVTVKTKSSGTYQFSYADLASIWDTIRKPLAENELSILQVINGDSLETILCHSSGETIKSTMRLNCTGSDIKGMGAAITYYRRYALSALLGIVSDEDVDSIESEAAEGAFDKAIDRGKLNHIEKILKNKLIMKKQLIEHYGELAKIPDSEFKDVCQSISKFKPVVEKCINMEVQTKIEEFKKRNIEHEPFLTEYVEMCAKTSNNLTIEEVLIQAMENEEGFLNVLNEAKKGE